MKSYAILVTVLVLAACTEAFRFNPRKVVRSRGDNEEPTAAAPPPPPTTTLPSKPQWADVFDAPFGLNVKSSNYSNVTSHFYYDWTYQQSSLITYPDKCLPGITTLTPCNLVFNNVGCYLFTPKDPVFPFKPENQQCCLLFPGVGSLPPNFLAPFNFSTVEVVQDMYGKNHTCDKWHNFGFAYWTSVATGNDIQVRDGPGDTFWNYGTLNFPNSYPESLFYIPPDCSTSCLLDTRLDKETRLRLSTLAPERVMPFPPRFV
jgi:hypothetical protein